MFNIIQEDITIKMTKCFDLFQNYINTIHSRRISVNVFNTLQISCYGKKKYLNQISSIHKHDVYTLLITVFDPKLVKIIVKSIQLSRLDVNIISSGTIIKVKFPEVTQEYINNLIKLIDNESEKSKICIRNIRRNINNQVKQLLKNKKINHDEEKKIYNNVQNITDLWIDKINNLTKIKCKKLI